MKQDWDNLNAIRETFAFLVDGHKKMYLLDGSVPEDFKINTEACRIYHGVLCGLQFEAQCPQGSVTDKNRAAVDGIFIEIKNSFKRAGLSITKEKRLPEAEGGTLCGLTIMAPVFTTVPLRLSCVNEILSLKQDAKIALLHPQGSKRGAIVLGRTVKRIDKLRREIATLKARHGG